MKLGKARGGSAKRFMQLRENVCMFAKGDACSCTRVRLHNYHEITSTPVIRA